MTLYVIQVKTGGEDKYLKYASVVPDKGEVKFIWPRRKLRIRRHGIWRNSLAPIFPGYLFLEVESVSPELYWKLKRIPGFFRFLKDNHQIEPLATRDKDILTHFLAYGEIVEKSLVTFDKDNRIIVLDGPLKGLEGRIVKVDKRKGRARIALEMYEDSFLIDFGFDTLGRAEK